MWGSKLKKYTFYDRTIEPKIGGIAPPPPTPEYAYLIIVQSLPGFKLRGGDGGGSASVGLALVTRRHLDLFNEVAPYQGEHVLNLQTRISSPAKYKNISYFASFITMQLQF